MKTLSFCAVLLISIFSFNTSLAQTAKTETIKVWGNCGMCKTTIEKAAKQAGAKTADWNEDSKELQVSYAVNKTTSVKIQQAIAKSGYDTQDFTADNKAYDKLHSCCKYDRKGATASSAKPKCCENEKCGTGVDCCGDMNCCKDKACCSKKDGAAMKCCTTEKCVKETADCKSAQCCKEKSCCKS